MTVPRTVGRNPFQRVQGNHGEEPVAEGACPARQMRRRQLRQRQQADEVDRVVCGRVPLGEAFFFHRAEPLVETLLGQLRLLLSGPAGRGEGGVRPGQPGQELGDMETQGVVLAPEPHDVIAGLVDPIAIAEHRSADARAHFVRQFFGMSAKHPQQRHHDEPVRPEDDQFGEEQMAEVAVADQDRQGG